MNDDYLRFNEQGLAEVNPMAGYNAQQEFIDNYRNAQAEKTAQIGEQAHALGSDLTAQYGGLHGPSEYWLSRYQTPQTESRLAGLRAANQAQALNQLMKNDLEREADKYNQAYRNYRRTANGGTSSTKNSDYDSTQGKVNFTSLESLNRAGRVDPALSMVYDTTTSQLLPGQTVIAPEGVDENGNARAIVLDANGNIVINKDQEAAAAEAKAQTAQHQQDFLNSWRDRVYRYYDVSSDEELQNKLFSRLGG